ncbi:hypothetical protein DICPUDRAFT_155123 [Dictyostelium purpureum]|uniref:N-acetyltransferase domain-containing protein n=1 Tax=Dictyostelium purpureum TaxID=5786 RepID=F0ZT47_DICPU|nr:uncharacterized protein DICPUDRAFT_155123 [Dictyostelium purpureum]EGC32879.1 hypothetical protein DICPUDRAFT_155123 [Dictyostelium purpureum]|eukprot:XP_003290598.1 hypothetical protein DICPUDRAFT_155123 [Dictyostelium purpureum]
MIKFHYIHNKKQYSEELAKLLNSQWPRSEYSRMVSIEKSSDQLPLFIIMIKSDEITDENNNIVNTDELVGCLSISQVLNIDKNSKPTVLIENVLVKPIYRGKGYGKMIMNEAHSIIKEKQYCVSYLSTHDKKEFYKTFGYEECEPLITSNFSSNSSGAQNSSSGDNYNNDIEDDSEKVSNLLRIFGGGNSNKIKKEEKIYWMKLNLA